MNQISQNSKLLLLSQSVALIAITASVALALSACSPNSIGKNVFVTPNTQTGLIAEDGKVFTGAGPAAESSALRQSASPQGQTPKPPVESAPVPVTADEAKRISAERALASTILSAWISNEKSTETAQITVLVQTRDNGILKFTFKKAELNGDSSVRGLKDANETTQFEMRAKCTQDNAQEESFPQSCRTLTAFIKIKNSARESSESVGIIIRNQLVKVVARTRETSIRNSALEKLLATFKQGQIRQLQSYEVAWGPAGFALILNDSNICPVGRLVETNELNEPLKTICPSGTDSGVSGQMIGNTTHGEVFLEFKATTGLLNNSTESVFMLVTRAKKQLPVASPSQQLKVPTPIARTIKAPPAPGSWAIPPKTPPQTAADSASPPAQGSQQSAGPQNGTPPISTPAATNDDDDGTELEFLLPPPKAVPTARTTPGTQKQGWLIPLDLGKTTTQILLNDRKHPIIAAAVVEQLSKYRTMLNRFATYFAPNRDTIVRILEASGAPAETAFLTLRESEFFRNPNYPIQIGTKGDLGPWQFMLDTGRYVGLRVFPANRPSNYNACDQRADLFKSTAAAGRYMSQLLAQFPTDPKLAILAYNWGPGNANGAVQKLNQRLDEIRNSGVSYWTVRKFNMSRPGPIDYVEKYVAIFHAFLEMPPQSVDPSVKPWIKTKACL